MSRILALLLALLMLLGPALPAAGAETSGTVSAAERQALETAVRKAEGREIHRSVFLRLPGADLPCAFFITKAKPQNNRNDSDFAIWYAVLGRQPQKVLEGLTPLGEATSGNPLLYFPTGHLQGFIEHNQAYFMFSVQTEDRDSMETKLYRANARQVQLVEGLYYGAWHEQTGPYHLEYDYVTDSMIEAWRNEVPYFTTLVDGRLRGHITLEIRMDDLHALTNGAELVRELRNIPNQLLGLYYLPNNMVVASYARDLKEDWGDDREYSCLFIGIENNTGYFVRYRPAIPLDTGSMDWASRPFWQVVNTAFEAMAEGRYSARTKGGAHDLRPTAFLDTHPLAHQFSLGAASEVIAQGGLRVEVSSSRKEAKEGDQVTLTWTVSGGIPPYSGMVFSPRDVVDQTDFEGATGSLDFQVRAGMPMPLSLMMFVRDAVLGDDTPRHVPVPLTLTDGWLWPDEKIRVDLPAGPVPAGQPFDFTLYIPYLMERGGYEGVYIVWTLLDGQGKILQETRQPRDGNVGSAYRTDLQFTPGRGAILNMQVRAETNAGDGSYVVRHSRDIQVSGGQGASGQSGQSASGQSGQGASGQSGQGAPGVPARLNQRMATRSGPATKYSEELGTLPQNTPIRVIEVVSGSSTKWVMVEFEKGGQRYRAYTGLKRVDTDHDIPAGSETYTTTKLSRTATAYYGPGTDYARRRAQVQKGTSLRVFDEENGYYLCDFQLGGTWVRAWLPWI